MNKWTDQDLGQLLTETFRSREELADDIPTRPTVVQARPRGTGPRLSWLQQRSPSSSAQPRLSSSPRNVHPNRGRPGCR